MGEVLTIEQAKRFVIDHALEPMTTRELAELAGYSPNHFHRRFRDLFGETPLEVRNRRRLTEAERLLSRGHHVSDACLAVGFESLASFSHLFLRHTGYRPSEFRRVFPVPDIWAYRRIPACFLQSR